MTNTSDTPRAEEQLYRIAEMAMGQQENWGISERAFWDAVKRSLASLSARNAELMKALRLTPCKCDYTYVLSAQTGQRTGKKILNSECYRCAALAARTRGT